MVAMTMILWIDASNESHRDFYKSENEGEAVLGQLREMSIPASLWRIA